MPCGSSDSRRRAEHRPALLRTRICRRCSGEGSASYSLHISRFPPSRTTRFRSILWRRFKKRSIVSRWDAPRRECAHSGHPRPLSICAGVTSHSCPHFRNRNRVFSSAFTYGPTMITSSLRDFSSSTNSAWDFRMVPAHLGQPWPRNRLPPTGAHSQPHTSHLTATRERQFSYVPTTVILRFRAFRARTNSGWLFFFIMRSGYAVKRKSRHKPAPVSVRWIGDVSGAPRPNARRRRQDPRRRPAGVSSGSPTSGGS